MKRFLVLLLGLLILAPLPVLAAGTIVQTSDKVFLHGDHRLTVVTLTCTADVAAASFPTTGGAIINPATLGITGWYLRSVETDPGATAPTALYDIVINDARGRDKAGGLLANRAAATTEEVFLAGVGEPQILDNWTFTITNNLVNSAQIVAKLIFSAD